MKNNNTQSIEYTSLGACTVSKNVLIHRRVTWGIHNLPQKDIDSGWIFLSEFDTEEYLKDKSNWSIVTLERILDIAPFLISVLGYPIGFEFSIDYETRAIFASDTNEIILKF